MLKLLKSVGVGALVFAAIYLMGVFAQADFNIVNWGHEARGATAFLGGMVAFFAAFFAFMEMFND